MNSRLWSSLAWLKTQSGIAAALSLRYRGALKDDGWFRSVANHAPVDGAGEPIPWISYPALHFLKARTQPGWHVFEFGAGYSTLWWARRGERVVACESDASWHAQVQKLAPANVETFLAPTNEYPSVVARYPETFDVVVLDGGDRVLCAKSAVSALKPDGVILWDDTDRAEYKEGFEFLRSQGFAQLEFVGLGPILNITKATSIFYRPRNVLRI